MLDILTAEFVLGLVTLDVKLTIKLSRDSHTSI